MSEFDNIPDSSNKRRRTLVNYVHLHRVGRNNDNDPDPPSIRSKRKNLNVLRKVEQRSNLNKKAFEQQANTENRYRKRQNPNIAIRDQLCLAKSRLPNKASLEQILAGEEALLDATDEISTEIMEHRSKNVIIAIHAFYEQSGSTSSRLPIPTTTEEPRMAADDWEINGTPPKAAQIVKFLKDQIVSDVTKQETISLYNQKINMRMTLLLCAVCGERHFDDGNGNYVSVPFGENQTIFEKLELDQNKISQYTALGEYSEASSVVILSGKHYFMHKEGIATVESQQLIDLCRKCYDCLQSMKLPHYSIANQRNYGCLHRLKSFPDVNFLEEILISKTRLYLTVIKFTPVGQSNESSKNVLNSHIISFPHDGPQAAAEINKLPSPNDVARLIRVEFVGHKNKYDAVMRQILKSNGSFYVRPHVVIKYLKLLKRVNPFYHDIEIDETEETLNEMEQLPNILADMATFDESKQSEQIEKLIQTDMARIHHDNNELQIGDDDFVQVSHCLVTKNNSFMDGDKSTSLLLNTLAKDLNIHSPDNHHQNVNFDEAESASIGLNISSKSRITTKLTSEVPESEFGCNDQLIMRTFPLLFLFGEGVHSKSCLENREVEHLLNQYSNRFAQNARLRFLLFNQKQRHLSIKSVSTRVRNNKHTVKDFANLVNDDDFKKRLKVAIKDPKSDDAKTILKAIGPMVQSLAGKIPYSIFERQSLKSEIVAYCHYLGPASMLVTNSFDDIRNVLSIRLAFPSFNNLSFPAVEVEELLQQLQHGAKSFKQIDIDVRGLTIIAAKNPIATSSIFKLMMNVLYDVLFGIPAEHTTKTTTPLSQRKQGVFGFVRAAISALEDQKRLTLHRHTLLWLSLSPQLLQRIAAYPELVKIAQQAIDSLITTTMTIDSHMTGVLGAIERNTNDIEKQSNSDRPTWHECPPLESADFEKRLEQVQNQNQIHGHTMTCRKPPYGKWQCRLSKLSTFNDVTGPLQIDFKQSQLAKGGERPKIVFHDKIQELDSSMFNPMTDPFGIRDTRCLSYCIKRPQITVPNLDALSHQTRTKLLNLPADKQRLAWNKVKIRNAQLVECNPVMATLFCCNTAANFLGSYEDANSAMNYMAGYLSKTEYLPEHSLRILAKSLQHVKKYPSKAEDKNTEERQNTYLLQHILNQHLSGVCEYSDGQISAALLNLPANILTHKTGKLFIKAAITHVNEAIQNQSKTTISTAEDDSSHSETEESMKEDDQIEDSEQTDDNNNYPMEEIDQIDEPILNDEFQASNMEKNDSADSGYAFIYTVADKHIAVTQHEHYMYRGNSLKNLSLYEYVAIIQVKQRNSNSSDTKLQSAASDPTEEQNSTTDSQPPTTEKQTNFMRRSKNATFEFDAKHPLHKTHLQMIRSKLLIPCVVGQFPPSDLGIRRTRRSKVRRAAEDRLAIYYMTLHCPWNSDKLIPNHGVTWKDFCNYTTTLRQSTAILDQAKLSIMTNMSRTFSTNNLNRTLLNAYRRSNATIWNSHTDFSDDNYKDEMHKAGKTILDMETELRDQQEAQETMEFLQAQTMDLQLEETTETQSFINDNVITPLVNMLNQVYPLTQRANSIRLMEYKKEQFDLVQKTVIDKPTANLNLSANIASSSNSGIIQIPVETADDIKLNPSQQQVIEMFDKFFAELAQFKSNKMSNAVKPKPPMVLLHGAGGTGKTVIIKELTKRAQKRGMNIVSCAPTGAAASNINNASTMHRIFHSLRTKKRNGASAKALAELKSLFESAACLIVDEISMCTLSMILTMSDDLSQCFDTDEAFGGIATLLSGDFWQIVPVTGNPIYSEIVQLIGENFADSNIQQKRAYQLLALFKLVRLEQQMRATDANHAQIIASLRDLEKENVIDDQIIHYLDSHKLNVSDFDDAEWRYATQLVCTNAERVAINWQMAIQFAKDRSQPVIAWRLPIESKKTNSNDC